MLALKVKENEDIFLKVAGYTIKVRLCSMTYGSVVIGIEAPKAVAIFRGELLTDSESKKVSKDGYIPRKGSK